MRDRERGAETQAEGEAGSMWEAGCGTPSRDPGSRAFAFGSGRDPEIKSRISLPAWSLPLPLPVSLPLSLSVSLMNK